MPANSKSRLLFVTLILALLAGCADSTGGGGGGGGGGRGTTSANALVNLQDAAPDRVLALKLQITDVRLHQTSSATASVLNAASGVTVETIYRQALPQPVNLSVSAAAPSTYDRIDVTFASTGASVTFVDNLGVIRQDTSPTFNSTSVSIPLSPNVTISDATPVVVNLTFQPSSIAINTVSNTATITPTMSATMTVAGTPATQTDSTGLVRGFTGVVNGAPGAGSFQLSSSQLANPVTINTNTSTTFSGDISAFATIVDKNILQVTAQYQTDGTLLARSIDGENAGVGLTTGGDFRGIATSVTHDALSPFLAQNMALRVQNVSAAAGAVVPGTSVAVNFTAIPAPSFLIDQQDVDLTNLGTIFTPVFDSRHLQTGQEISLIYATAPSTPKKLKLRLQTFGGQAGAAVGGAVAGQTTFPLILAADHWFVLLTGHNTITVVRQPSSVTTAATPSAGNPIHARGLLFWDPSPGPGGSYFLVADQFTP
jgi:hypothetical protein